MFGTLQTHLDKTGFLFEIETELVCTDYRFFSIVILKAWQQAIKCNLYSL
jgi:hypothetical protein